MAVHLIRDAKAPAFQIHLIESRRTFEDGFAITGDPVSGYNHRAAHMASLSDICIENLLSFVPSAPHSAKAVMDNIGKAKTGPAPINLFIQCGRDLEIKYVSKFSM